MHRKLLPMALVVLLVGCGSSAPPKPNPKPSSAAINLAAAKQECPQAADGRGHMGACAPKSLRLTVTRPTAVVGPTYVDLSNNDPCDCGAAIRAQGHVGLIVKLNQGGFVDSTAAGMVASARAARLAVGGYDFDQNYNVPEAKILVVRLRAVGILPHTRNTFPVIFDIEYGAFSLTGLRAQIRYVQAQGYRVAIYTGGWYWTPHAGCTWVGLPAWLAGYPTAPIFCGLPVGLYNDHQYTSTGNVTSTLTGDVSVHTAGLAPFERYVNNAPVKPTKLATLITRRNRLRQLETRRSCRTRPHGYGACRVWLPEGQRIDRQIARLEK